MAENEQGEQGDWRESLGVLKEAPWIAKAESPEKALQELQNAANMVGSSIRVPGPDVGEQDLSEFHSRVMEKVPGLMAVPKLDDPDQVREILGKMGMPKEAENYQVPEGVEFDGDTLGKIKSQAHKEGLTQQQFQARVSAMHEEATGAQTQRQQFFDEQKALLKGEWGAAYDERVNEIAAFLEQMGADPDDLEAVKSGEAKAGWMQALYRMSQLGDEPTGEARSQGDGGERKLTPMEAEAQLAEVENRIYTGGQDGRPMAPDDPNYQYLINRRMELMKAKNAGKAA
jgi:hypothetical protein